MKRRFLNILTAGAVSCAMFLGCAGSVAMTVSASDMALAGAESADDAGDASDTGGAVSKGSHGFESSEPELLSADEMVTVLGSHSTLTNELVADEYEWVKTNLAGSYMPYVIPHAEGNPNVIHFLYVRAKGGVSPETFEYTDEEREKKIPPLGDDVTGLVPLLMQWDWRWAFNWYGGGPAALTACAPTCMAMIGFGLTGDESINPLQMCQYAENAGYWVPGSGTSWDLVLNAFPNHPITGQKISPDQYTITAELNAGHPVLINVGVGKFSAVGHFMILAGMDANGNFILNDPNNLENCSKTWPWEDLSSEITAAWSYSYNG